MNNVYNTNLRRAPYMSHHCLNTTVTLSARRGNAQSWRFFMLAERPDMAIPFGHTDHTNFHRNIDHKNWLAKLENETQHSSDEFIHQYQKTYTGFPTVSIWMLTEVMSFGSLSFFYKGLRNDAKSGVQDKSAVAQYFNLHHKRLGDWLHILTHIRNLCAHHSLQGTIESSIYY